MFTMKKETKRQKELKKLLLVKEVRIGRVIRRKSDVRKDTRRKRS